MCLSVYVHRCLSLDFGVPHKNRHQDKLKTIIITSKKTYQMSKPRKSYSKAEKLEIVKLSLNENESVKSISERFEISVTAIYNWRRKYLKNKETAFPGKGNKEMTVTEKKIHDLEKRLRETELERDILKKAVGIFSKNDRKFSNL